MRHYQENDRLCDIISSEHRMLQVLSRFGISLGFSEKSVKEVCREQGVNLETFLAVANFLVTGEVEQEQVKLLQVGSLLEYLQRAHNYFLDFALPSIRRKLIEAINCSLPGEHSFLIIRYFDEYVQEVNQHMKFEDETVFSKVKELINGTNVTDFHIEDFERKHDKAETRITEFKTILLKYFHSQENCYLLNSALFDIYNCEEDLKFHYEMEEHLFIPAVRQLERQVGKRRRAISNANEQVTTENVEPLSKREKAVIVEVVKGLTNKEIADKLFISVHTVTTHRKNIARKLQIHSAAGLTIYAIANQLVQLDELQIK